MHYNQRSLNSALDTLKAFEARSGMKINIDKTTIYRIGSIKKANAKLYTRYKISWSNDPLNLLGVLVSRELQEVSSMNFSETMNKATRILKSWQHRNLSLLGKVQVVNSLIYSLFVYQMSVMDLLTKEDIAKFNKVIRNFIWDNKKSKIPFEILTVNKDQGGVGLVDIELKDKVSKVVWVFKLFRVSKIRTLAYEILQNPLGDYLWETELQVKDIHLFFPRKHFWTDVLKSWCEFRGIQGKNVNVEDQIIWMHSGIRINQKPLVWIRKGILKIGQLKDSQGFLNIEQFQDKFPGIPFTEYYGLIDAIKNMECPQGMVRINCFNFYKDLPKQMCTIYCNWNFNDHRLEYHFLIFKNSWSVADNSITYDDYI